MGDEKEKTNNNNMKKCSSFGWDDVAGDFNINLTKEEEVEKVEQLVEQGLLVPAILFIIIVSTSLSRRRHFHPRGKKKQQKEGDNHLHQSCLNSSLSWL